jgi:DNA-binding NarL/FixJ family response regulator
VIHVLIADDQKLAREGLNALLSTVQDIAVVGMARDGKEAVNLALRLKPDVVLMDIEMPGTNGLQATGEIHRRAEEVAVLIVAWAYDLPLVRQALDNGARGFVAKNEFVQELIPAVRAVREGKTYLAPPSPRCCRSARMIASKSRNSGADAGLALTRRGRDRR